MAPLDREPPNPVRLSHSDFWICVSTFVALLGIHTLCLGGELGYTDDAMPILRHTEMVIRHGTFVAPISPAGDFSMYGIGMTLWYLPFRLLGGFLIPESVAPMVSAFYLRLAYIYLNTLATAATGALLCAWGLSSGYSKKASVMGPFCFSMATLALPYARYDFSEPVTGFFVVGGVFLLWRYRSSRSWRHLLAAGALLGAGALTRIVVGLAIVPLLGFVWFSLNPKSRSRDAVCFLFPLSICAGILLAYNFGRFGDPFETGYPIDFKTPFLTGIIGLLISWGRGLMFYSPISVIGLFLFWASNRFDLWTRSLVGFLFLFFLLLHAKWSYWYGGWCWGPRLLLPVLPFAALGLIHLFERANLRRIAATLLFGVGGLINLLAIYVPFSIYYETALKNGFHEDWILWRRFYSPLLIHHEMLTQVVALDYDFVWLSSNEWGWPTVAIGLVGAGLAILGLKSLYVRIWKSGIDEESPSLVRNPTVE